MTRKQDDPSEALYSWMAIGGIVALVAFAVGHRIYDDRREEQEHEAYLRTSATSRDIAEMVNPCTLAKVSFTREQLSRMNVSDSRKSRYHCEEINERNRLQKQRAEEAVAKSQAIDTLLGAVAQSH